MSESEPLDLLAGAVEIAAFMRLSRRQVYHLVETSRLPVFRLGTQLCARRSTLLRWIEDMERSSAAIIEA
jgi:excisionase family DNA binding protein